VRCGGCGGQGNLFFRFGFEIFHSGFYVSLAHSRDTVANWKLGVAIYGIIWPILRTTALKEEDRFGEIKVKQYLYSPITAITVPGI
jgi:hypothetical protein